MRANQLVWVNSPLSELGITINTIPLCRDNQGAIFMGSNPVQECCIKHIDIRYHYIHEVLHSGNVELFFIDGAENSVDMLTKNLGHVKFLKFRGQLGLEFISPN